MKALVVISPFGEYEVGESITDESEIEDILDGENAHHVVASDHDESETAEEE